MFRFLSILFGDDDAIGGDREAHFTDLQIAAAALMVEAARVDGTFADRERATIEGLLVRHFRLPAELARQLMVQAERAADASVAWQGFTHAIKEALAPEQRQEIIEMLWEVAYADGELHDYQSSLLRRVAGLLYVDDRDSGEIRLRVMDRLGIPR